MKFIGLVPAAGYARRLGLRSSKELLRLGPPPGRAVCEFLLSQMRTADIKQALIIVREGKHDIPAYLGDGRALGIFLSYVITAATPSVPHTLDHARAPLRTAVTVLGFPDIIVEDGDSLLRLVQAYRTRPVDVLLGLFPLTDPLTMDAVAWDGRRVLGVWPKLGAGSYTHTWAFAIWSDRFSDFMHDWLGNDSARERTREPYVGDVIHAAIEAGLGVEGVTVSQAPFLDIGTPEGLARARDRLRESVR